MGALAISLVVVAVFAPASAAQSTRAATDSLPQSAPPSLALTATDAPAGPERTPRSAGAPAVDTLRLSTLLEDAARQNPSLQAARLRAEARSSRQAQAEALPDPSVGATYFPYSVLTARGAQRSQWRVSQSFPFPGTRALRGRVAALDAEAARADADAAGQDVALSVRRAYYTLYRVQAQERLIRRFQADLEQFEQVATTQYEVGTEGQPAVLKAQIERQRLAIRLETLAAERRSALETLARLTGQPDLADAPLAVRVDTPAVVADASVATALQRRPEARRLRRQIERANRQVDLAAKDGLPRFTLGAQYVDIAATGRTPMMNGQDALALSVGVQVPLWRGKQRAQAAEARSQRRQAEASLEALRQEVETRVRDLQHRIERQRRQLALLDDTLLPKAETALEATLSAYRTGQSDFLDLLDAERTLFQLRLDRASTHARLLKTQAELDRTLGRTPLPAPASPETQ